MKETHTTYIMRSNNVKPTKIKEMHERINYLENEFQKLHIRVNEIFKLLIELNSKLK